MKFTRVLSILGIGCVLGLLLVFGIRLQAQNRSNEKLVAATENRPQMEQRSTQFRNRQQGSNWGGQGRQQNWGGQNRQQNRNEQQRSNNSNASSSTDYYRVIVDNNIFRPLGWRPPRQEPEYTFIGTSTSADGSKLEGYILERRSNKFYTAVIGDKIGDAVVTEIKQKQILLDKGGEVITLNAGNMQFLQAGSSRGSSRSNNNRDNNSDQDRRASESRSSDKEKAAAEAKAKEEAERRAREERSRRWQEGMSRFRNASPEQREQMMRQYRERFRGGDRGGERRGGRDR